MVELRRPVLPQSHFFGRRVAVAVQIVTIFNREGSLMTSNLPLVERARRYLAALPLAETGKRGHDATFKAAACLVHGFGLDESASYALLASEYNPRCRPPWSAAELGHKIQSALTVVSDKPRGHLAGKLLDTPTALPGSAPKWPEPNVEEIRRVALAGPSALKLWEQSPHYLDVDDGSNCQQIVQALFASPDQPDPLVCVGKSNAEFATRPLSAWMASGKLSTLSLVVPSPMTARTGRTKDGRESEHTLENTALRRFLVIEFDKGSADDHAARLWHLAGYAPLSLVVHSGGKSLHGWFYCLGEQEKNLRKFMSYAVSLGADKATWTRSQFVRLPGGQRDNGARQSVFYFDPGAININRREQTQ